MVLTSHELVPRLQCSVDLHHLHNIDLFATGYYQIRCRLRAAAGPPARVDVALLRTTCAAAGLFPASVVDGAAASQTVEVLYADERVALDDRVDFDVTVPQRVEKVHWIELVLSVELWHMDKDDMLENAGGTCDMHSCFRRVASRPVHLRVSPARGLHAHRPVVFDYYHLCSVAITVHASLVGLQQRCRSNGGKLELGRRASASNEDKVRLAHRTACLLLLQAYESVQLRIRAYSKLLRHGSIIRIQLVDTVLKLDALYRRFDEEPATDRLLILAEHVQLLAGELRVLWTQFLELFRGRPEVARALAKEHSVTRMKRYGEAFFYSEDTVHGLLSSSFVSTSGSATLHQAGRIADLVRKSAYLHELPQLPCAVPESDATPAGMPVIFEYKYVPGAGGGGGARAASSVDGRSRSSKSNGSDSDGGSVRRLKDCLNLELRQCARPAGTAATAGGGGAAQPGKRCLLQVSTSSACTSSMASSSPSPPAGERHHRRRGSAGGGVYLASSLDGGALAALHRSRTEPNLSVDREGPATVDSAVGGAPSPAARLSASSRSVFCARRAASECVGGGGGGNEVYLPIDEALLKAGDKDLGRTARSRLCAALRLKSAGLRAGRRRRHRRKQQQHEQAASASDSNGNGGGSGDTEAAPESPPDAVAQLTATVDSTLVRFVTNKEAFKAKLALTGYPGHLYSDFRAGPQCADNVLVQLEAPPLRALSLSADRHIVVCVHGLEGSRDDLRPYVNALKLACPGEKFDFLMSEANECSTYECFERMGENLLDELAAHVDRYPKFAGNISFVSHSMGAVIVRAALAHERCAPYASRLHCFLSLNGPHCGLLLNQKTASLGVSLVQWWKRSASLEQLCLRDARAEPRRSFLYKLSQSAGIAAFRYVLLVGSAADLYVPCHSALVQPCKPAQGKHQAQIGAIYNEMVANVCSSIAASTRPMGCTLVRYLCYHGRAADAPRSQHLLGRAAHVAPLDDDVFVEKLMGVSAARYFAS